MATSYPTSQLYTNDVSPKARRPVGPPPGWPEPDRQPFPGCVAAPPVNNVRRSLVWVVVVQFLTAAVIGFLGVFWCLLLIGYKTTDPGAYLIGVGFAAVTTLHLILDIGILQIRRWAILASVCVSALYAAITLALALPLIVQHDAHGWEQGLTMGLPVLALIVSADVVALRNQKRAR